MEVPLQESEAPRSVYQVIYYGLLGTSSLIGGLAAAIVLMLHRTILGLSHAVAPGTETDGFVRTGDGPRSGAPARQVSRASDGAGRPRGTPEWQRPTSERRVGCGLPRLSPMSGPLLRLRHRS